jgi:hypothetical protein
VNADPVRSDAAQEPFRFVSGDGGKMGVFFHKPSPYGNQSSLLFGIRRLKRKNSAQNG